MGKIKKKGTTGTAAKYITRNQALKRLQLGLADFRRLCILKGIYPREPDHKKKIAGSANSLTTFYYLKDIQYLAHEPLLAKFRQMKTFHRKLKKYIGKHEWAKVRSLEENAKPSYSLDHIVRERYPSFADALRDLDDALSMVFLFATLAQSGAENHREEVSRRCSRLAREFEAFAIRSGSLRKAFISIKGIYFQAEILAQTVTWIVPHEFATQIPTDVDFRVMLTFLEFYQALLGFVNFKLFARLGWAYPSSLVKDDQAQSFVLASQLPVIEETDGYADVEENKPRLFSNFVMFISREVPKKPLAFLLQSLGATICWATDDGSSPITDDDPSITHQIVDRPTLSRMFVDRHYVQPQWVFDCLNAGQVLDVASYRIGEKLPPHMSPFVQESSAADEEMPDGAPGESDEATAEKKERKQLALGMMSKKRQKLYKQMQHTRQRKADQKQRLDGRRQKLGKDTDKK